MRKTLKQRCVSTVNYYVSQLFVATAFIFAHAPISGWLLSKTGDSSIIKFILITAYLAMWVNVYLTLQYYREAIQLRDTSVL